MAATQSHMQDRTLFGGVDGFAFEHCLRLAHDLRFFSQGQELCHHFGCDALTLVVDADARTAGMQGGVALLVFEQLTQVRLCALCQSLQREPCLAFVWGDECGHGVDFRQIY